jgi:prepilin-type N-terminal cleavage/methylation domain-containing protein
MTLNNKTYISAGFTIAELIVTLSIVGLLSLIAFPNLQEARNQLRVTDDSRSVALLLSDLRTESIRLKRNTTISFAESSISWDFFSDGNIDGTYTFAEGVTWEETPDDIIINGFGLIRAASTDLTLVLTSDSIQSTITINSNGHINL